MRWRRWLLIVAGYLLAVAFVGLSAAAGWMYWDRVEVRGEQAARAVLPGLAAKEIPEVFAYDYQTVERSLSAAYPLLTPDYRAGSRRAPTPRSFPKPRSAKWWCRPTSWAWESCPPNGIRRR